MVLPAPYNPKSIIFVCFPFSIFSSCFSPPKRFNSSSWRIFVKCSFLSMPFIFSSFAASLILSPISFTRWTFTSAWISALCRSFTTSSMVLESMNTAPAILSNPFLKADERLSNMVSRVDGGLIKFGFGVDHNIL